MSKPWFRPKKFGYGWTPVTWQGWVVTIILALIIVGSIVLLGNPK